MGALSLIKDGNTYATAQFATSATIAYNPAIIGEFNVKLAKQNRTGVYQNLVFILLCV